MVHEEDKYGPWMVVTRRRGGQKGTTKGMEQSDPTKSGQSSKQKDSLVRNKSSNGNKAWKENTELGFTPKINLDMAGQDVLSLGPNLKLRGLMDKDGLLSKAHASPSVKAKKAITRSRALTHLNKEVASSSKSIYTSAAQAVSFLGNNGGDASSLFQFSAAAHADLGIQSKGEVERAPHADLGIQSQGKLTHSSSSDGGSRNHGVADDYVGVDLSKSEEGLEVNFSLDGRECKVGLLNTGRPIVGKDEEPAMGVPDKTRERKDGGENGEDMMEFEDEGGTGISS